MSQTETGHGPLPDDLLGELLEILDRDSAPGQREAELERLCAEHPRHAAMLRKVVRGAAAMPSLPLATPTRIEPSALPERIGPYRILHHLGDGAMGSVYLGEHVDLRRHDAVKVLRAGVTEEARFQQEARVLARLRHPNICGVHEFGDADGQRYIGMQYVEGVTLHDALEHARQPTGQTDSADHDHQVAAAAACLRPTTPTSLAALLTLFEKVALAADAAHRKEVVHRDLKPQNVIVQPDGEPMILDFGIAFDRADDDPTLTRPGFSVGTPAYMSPEQIRHPGKRLDGRSDVFSLAVMLWECLTLERPFCGTSTYELLGAIQSQEITNPRRLNPVISEDLRAVLERSLEKDPRHRYATAADFADDLQRLRTNRTVKVRRVGTTTRAYRWLRRNPVPSLAIAALVAGVIGTTWGLWSADANARARDTALRSEQIRTRELERVADFQSDQLGFLSAASLAVDLRDSLVEAIDPDARERFEADLETANLVDVAVTLLRRSLLEPTIEAIDDQFAELPRIRARLLSSAAHLSENQGVRDGVVELLERVLQLLRDQYGDEHPETLKTTADIARCLIDRGAFEAAADRIEKAERICRTALGTDNAPILADILRLRGRLLQEAGSLTEAESSCREAYDLAVATHGLGSAETVSFGNDLGVVLSKRGKKRESIEIYRACLSVDERENPEFVAGRISVLSNLGQNLADLGELDEAARLLHQCLNVSREAYGEKHPTTITAMYDWGFFLLVIKHQAEAAEPYLRSALEGRRRVLGRDHPLTLNSVGSMAALMRDLGRLEDALPYLREDYEANRRILAQNHPTTLIALSNLGACLRMLGRLEEARAAGEKAVAAFPPDLYKRAFVLDQYAHTLFELKRYREAESAGLEAWRIYEASRDSAHQQKGNAAFLRKLYDTWHAADPTGGHQADLERWRETAGDR